MIIKTIKSPRELLSFILSNSVQLEDSEILLFDIFKTFNIKMAEKIKKGHQEYIYRTMENFIVKLLFNGNFKIQRKNLGAPYLHGKVNMFCSISHKNGLLIFAYSSKPIGIDIESLNNKLKNINALKYFFRKDEMQLLRKETDFSFLFGCSWSLKESYVKCLGTGLGDKNVKYISLNGLNKYQIPDGYEVEQTFYDNFVITVVCKS